MHMRAIKKLQRYKNKPTGGVAHKGGGYSGEGGG